MIPSSYALYGQNGNGNEFVFRKDDSSTSAPHLLILNRSEPVWNAKLGRFTVSSLRVRVIRGVVDLEGNPIQTRVIFDGAFNFPPGHESEVDPLLTDVKEIINSLDFADVVKTLVIPTCCVDEPEE